MTVKNIVVIGGKETDIKDLKERERFAEEVNKEALLEKNYAAVMPEIWKSDKWEPG